MLKVYFRVALGEVRHLGETKHRTFARPSSSSVPRSRRGVSGFRIGGCRWEMPFDGNIKYVIYHLYISHTVYIYHIYIYVCVYVYRHIGYNKNNKNNVI